MNVRNKNKTAVIFYDPDVFTSEPTYSHSVNDINMSSEGPKDPECESVSTKVEILHTKSLRTLGPSLT